jgi:small-conductance mechanosensitive channel
MQPENRFTPIRMVTRLATAAFLCTAALLPIAASAQTATQRTAAPVAAPPAKPAPSASPPAASPAPAPSPPSADAVLRHLHETVSWYHTIETIAQNSDLSDGTHTRDGMRASALAALRSAFDFARAAARLVDATPHLGAPSVSDTSNDAVRLDRAATRLGARVVTTQKRIASIDSALGHATQATRQTLTAQRAEAVASLDLAREVQSTVTQLQQFAVSAAAHGGGTGGTLTSQVEEIEHTVPELRDNTSGASGANDGATPGASSATGTTKSRTDTAASSATARPAPALSEGSLQQPSGLVALVGEWLALKRIQHEFDAAIRQTDSLGGELDSLRTRVSAQVRTLVRLQGNPLDSASTDPQQLLASQLQLQNATAQFKQLATLVVPLSEQDISTDDARNSLVLLRATFDARSDAVRDALLWRLGVLIASVLLVLAISEAWRRATFRYLRDTRRRRQFLLLRRIVVVIALLLIIVMGFVSQMGSLATYVGFLTAGLALALQNVILAVVGYFFLIGRYGVRTGDRITLAGVTGRVIDIGLVRLYLMELSGPELQSTGRIVVLSNSVLFQPQALFKQIPGADYIWHSVTLALPPTTEVHSTQARLAEVAASVYATYRQPIDEQHAVVQKLIDFDTSRPEPHVDVHFTERALEFVVRYPVLPDHAAMNDQLMTRALNDAAGQKAMPDAKLAMGDTPVTSFTTAAR